MIFSFNRNRFVAKKLGKLNGEKVLDIGCRDKIFKTYLEGDFQYTGIDFNPDKPLGLDVVNEKINYNLENGIPEDIKPEIINALDVLEHVEKIHELLDDIFKKSKKVVSIALPNMAYYKFRFNFLFKGEISGKYVFTDKKIYDRHRWLPNYESILNFIDNNKPLDWDVEKFNYIAERKRNFVTYYIEKILSKIFPNLFVYEVIFIFRKKIK
tara:strand:- start:1111 stop:1743 length:633 start_codon:yes stop_codon:yes gene_type:complete